MKYLISGHPRTRSAWLAALLNAHGSKCYHDLATSRVAMEVDAGVSDPTLACIEPGRAMRACEGAAICVYREGWRPAIEAFTGETLSDWAAEMMGVNVNLYREKCKLAIPVAALEDRLMVKEVVELCTGEPASIELIEIFQLLKIEQHAAKARLALPISQLASAK